MVTLSTIIAYMYPNAVPNRDYQIADLGVGPYIVFWLPSLGSQPTQAEIDAAAPAAAKVTRIEADRTECRRRLTEYYGDALEQVSRASGLYGATAQANHAAGVSAAIDASNVARDQINAATTVAEVEAVTVVWPVLT